MAHNEDKYLEITKKISITIEGTVETVIVNGDVIDENISALTSSCMVHMENPYESDFNLKNYNKAEMKEILGNINKEDLFKAGMFILELGDVNRKLLKMFEENSGIKLTDIKDIDDPNDKNALKLNQYIKEIMCEMYLSSVMSSINDLKSGLHKMVSSSEPPIIPMGPAGEA